MDNILFWLVPVASVLALCFAYYFHKQMMKESEGTSQMIKIAAAVRKGAMSYLKQQYKIVGWVFLGLVILFSIMAYGFHVQNAWVPIAFLTGGFFSGLSGFLGMKTATYASARTANAARNSLNAGLRIAFRSGAVMGLVVVGLGLLDISFWYLLLNAVIPADALTPTHKLCVITTTMLTFGMGASTQALFARVGGGIYTKAADVGADLVGKVEAGIPEDDPRNPATIADNVCLKQYIVGQDEAVAAVTAAIRRNRVGISPKKRPVSFIFVGSTGVGKTELVKVLANELFESVESLIRLDMSEYMEKHSVSKIIGSPPGYVGYDEAGQLTEKIRRRPYSVILFDELEKAHPDVLNILLQILDDGRITDAQGRVVNFENTIIIMTSNAGSDRKDGSVGFGKTVSEQSKEKTLKALGEFLRPEFINRVDEVVCFNKLTEENFRAIAGIMLGELRDSLDARGLTFDWDGSLVDYLVKKSYSVQYGARNLRRTIQKDIEDPIAEKLIDAYQNPLHALHAKADGEHVTLESE